MMYNNKPQQSFKSAKKVALTGILFASAIVLTIVENSIPPIFTAVPGIKLGLSNIIVMYSLFFLGKGKAYTIAVLKGLFVFITRGLTAGILSICGGVLSLTVMAILIWLFREEISYLLVSVAGAVSHNLGQFIAISILYTYFSMWAYLPVLFIAGVVAGLVTSKLLNVILPALKKLGLK